MRVGCRRKMLRLDAVSSYRSLTLVINALGWKPHQCDWYMVRAERVKKKTELRKHQVEEIRLRRSWLRHGSVYCDGNARREYTHRD